MKADQTFKHFDSAQCDIRASGALLHLTNSYSTLYDVLLSGVEGYLIHFTTNPKP
jgi:hypothetical protein